MKLFIVWNVGKLENKPMRESKQVGYGCHKHFNADQKILQRSVDGGSFVGRWRVFNDSYLD